jgi:hypothetical protein
MVHEYSAAVNEQPPAKLAGQAHTALAPVGGARAWAREVESFDDDGLIAVVRSFNAVDRAVRGYRGRAAV